MKKHLKTLEEYEKNNDRYNQLCEYFIIDNTSLIKQYRQGIANLPSFMMLKKLHKKYSDLCVYDKELNELFLNAVNYSKLFYRKTIKLSKNTHINGIKFEKKFHRSIQKLGQGLINLLVSIKLRIKLYQSNNTHNYTTKWGKLKFLINKLTYKINLFQATNSNFSQYIYCLIITVIFCCIMLVNSLFLQNISHKLTVMLNIFFCGILGITAIIMYPADNFNKTDISGRNIIAYKYRLFFNNLSNKKAHDIFTLQYAHEVKHNVKLTVDSGK